MRKFLKIAVPLLLIILILLSISWYFFQYDSAFTRNTLVQYARKMEDAGRHELAVWLYDMAYGHSVDNDTVAIELAQQFKAIGNYTKAEYTLSKAIEDGGSLELYIALCQTYVEQNKLRDAVLMLDKVSDPQIRSQLQNLRPVSPAASSPSGTYMQYVSVSLDAAGATIYADTREDYPSLSTDLYTDPITLSAGQTTLFAVSVNEQGLVSSLSVYHYMVDNVVEEVTFADAAFETAVRSLLQVDENYVIHSNQLWDIAEFTIPEDAASYADLKWMPSLEVLTISGATAGSLQPLENLTKLHTVSVTNSSLDGEDLEAIASLPLMRELTLRNCGISTVHALAACRQLVYLDLSENAIRDIQPLSQMTELKQLDLHNNAVVDATAISGLSNLQTLDLSYNTLNSTAPLSTLSKLTALDVSANGLMKLEGLGTLQSLQHFSAAHNNMIDINALASCVNLVTLDVSYNTLLNIDIVANLTKLQELMFAHNEVSALPKFSASCALHTIDGSYNSLVNLDRLSRLENLQFVYMDYNTTISTVDSLRFCPALQEVHIYGTRVRNVSKLTEKGIFVEYTPVS